MAAGKGYDDIPTIPDYPRGWSIGDGSGRERSVKAYVMTSLQTFLCHIAYAGVVLLEVKHVSNSLNDWKDM